MDISSYGPSYLTSIDLTSSILGAMKAIKITDLCAKATKLLNNSRKDELDAAGLFRLIGVFASSLGKSNR